MSFLQLQSVSIGYQHKNKPVFVQEKLNIAANQGELIALIGKNGCGKSTLMRSIAHLQPIFEGQILIDGKDIATLTPKQRARLISIVLTDQRSEASFNVRELIAIGRDPYTGWLGSLNTADQQAIDKAMEMTNLSGFGHRNIHELSDGERQRVFIARALAQDTPIILLDEPTSHLDLPNRINILLLLQRLARETNKTIFISTHELETAMQAADKIWLMEKNNGIRNGIPEDMVLEGTFDTVFGHPSYEFDKEYGSFVIKKILDKQISTHVHNPNSLMARWTTKALSRKGYKIVNNAPITVVIDEQRRNWQVKTTENTLTTNRIEEVLEILSLH